MTLATFLNPRSVAVIGASPKTGSVGGRIIDQLREGFQGTIHPINPNYTEIKGLATVPSVQDLDAPVDVVLVAAGAGMVPGLLRDAVAVGIENAAVFSSGFGEMGGEGDRLQAELVDLIASSNLRMLGPNCLGYANFRRGLRATFTRVPFPEKDGNIAVVAQSGAMGISTAALLRADGAGLNFWAATGNELDVTGGELAATLLADPDESPDVIAMIIEGVGNVEHMLAAGRLAAQQDKQLVVLKVGRTETGARAAVSHTAAIAGSFETFRAACEQNGVVLVDSVRELVDTSRGFADGRRAKGSRLVIASGSGGTGVLMSDVAERAGLELPQPSVALSATLGELIPDFGSAANPVDITGNIVNDHSSVATLLKVLGESEEYDEIVFNGIVSTLPSEYTDLIISGREMTDKPFFALAYEQHMLVAMTERGLTSFQDPSSVITVMGHLSDAQRYSAFIERAEPAPSRAAILRAGSGTLSESSAKRVLDTAGISTPRELIVQTAEEAVDAAAEIDGPVVLKIDADWLSHKSDVGGVILGVRGSDAVSAGVAKLHAVAQAHRKDPSQSYGILVAEQVPAGIELMLGMTRDPIFGAVVTLAAGGVTAEISAESSTSVVPFNRSRAQSMLATLWGGRLLTHHRGISADAADTITDLVLALQQLAVDEPAITEIDVNPLIVSADRVVAVDALIVCGESA